MLSERTKEIIRTELPIMEGWCSPERGIELATLISKIKPLCVVEIGVFGGRSLVAQALALRELGAGHVFGIDPWKKEAGVEGEGAANAEWFSKLDIDAIHRGCIAAIWKLDLDKWATLIRNASQNCHSLFAKESIDFLSIDGNHSEVASTRDVHLYLPKVRLGGFVYFDDVDWEVDGKQTTRAAVLMLEEWCEFVSALDRGRIYRKVRAFPHVTGAG